jgi:hypothetical protein
MAGFRQSGEAWGSESPDPEIPHGKPFAAG